MHNFYTRCRDPKGEWGKWVLRDVEKEREGLR